MADSDTSTPTPANMPQHNPSSSSSSTESSPADETGESLDSLRRELKNTRREAAKYRERAKFAADDEWYGKATKALADLDKVESERKSETQKLTEELNAANSRATDAEHNVARLRAALRAGFTADDADDVASRLRGETDDELDADAKALRERFPTRSSTGVAPDPSQGAGKSGGKQAALNGDPLASLLRKKLKT